jgi:hypothetical protein
MNLSNSLVYIIYIILKSLDLEVFYAGASQLLLKALAWVLYVWILGVIIIYAMMSLQALLLIVLTKRDN